jgi:DNA processing protein
MEYSDLYYDEILLAFLSRESFFVGASEWLQTLSYLNHLSDQSVTPKHLAQVLPCWSRLEDFSLQNWQRRRDDLKRMHERGLVFLRYSELPEGSRLRYLHDPPRALVLLGHKKALYSKESLAIVGSREANPELLKWMDGELSQLLKLRPDLVIVSGGAKGVDQQAHICAIRNLCSTIIWLPSGVFNIYPKNLQNWMSAVLEVNGAFVSEYYPDCEMKKWHFHQRNRLIVGMCQACWVPQAQVKSGSYMSATLAAEAGVPVFVNPAHPWDASYSGNRKLLSEGANCLNSYQDILSEFRILSTIDRE